jgi:hypothetical protein
MCSGRSGSVGEELARAACISEIGVVLLETALVDCQEQVEAMEQHPIEDCALRMTRARDPRHIGRADSKSMSKSPLK